jgi:hypothetical protein
MASVRGILNFQSLINELTYTRKENSYERYNVPYRVVSSA